MSIKCDPVLLIKWISVEVHRILKCDLEFDIITYGALHHFSHPLERFQPVLQPA